MKEADITPMAERGNSRDESQESAAFCESDDSDYEVNEFGFVVFKDKKTFSSNKVSKETERTMKNEVTGENSIAEIKKIEQEVELSIRMESNSCEKMIVTDNAIPIEESPYLQRSQVNSKSAYLNKWLVSTVPPRNCKIVIDKTPPDGGFGWFIAFCAMIVMVS